MSGNTISVIVPAYNIAPWISRSLDSLLSQTHPDLEIIVAEVMKLPYGQLKKVLTAEVLAVLEKYGVKGETA